MRKKTVKEVRLSRKTLSQTGQVSKSSPLTEPVSGGHNHWHQELILQLLHKMSLSRMTGKIETANETDLVFSLLVFPDQFPTLCACCFPFPLHMCVHAHVCARVWRPEANLSCRFPVTIGFLT